MTVEILKPRDTNINLFIPEEVLQLLHPNYMVLIGSKLVATKRCRHMLSCHKSHPDTEAAVKKICEVLVGAGYVIVRKPNWNNALCAIAPEKYDSVYFQTTSKIGLSELETPHQVCLISATQLLCSAQSFSNLLSAICFHFGSKNFHSRSTSRSFVR